MHAHRLPVRSYTYPRKTDRRKIGGNIQRGWTSPNRTDVPRIASHVCHTCDRGGSGAGGSTGSSTNGSGGGMAGGASGATGVPSAPGGMSGVKPYAGGRVESRI